MVKQLSISREADADEAAMLQECHSVLKKKASRNKLRVKYAEGKMPLKDFGISIPPELRCGKTPVGWPRKAIDEHAKRSRFEGFVCRDEQIQGILESLVADNRMKAEYRQALRSELIQSCVFATVTANRRTARPEVQLHSLLKSAAVYDFSDRRIAYGAVFRDFDSRGNPNGAYLFHENGITSFKQSGGVWFAEPLGGTAMGRPMMVALANEPSLDRPFGQSKITREVMGTTDSAMRAFLNADVASHFAASPQKYLLGADKGAIEGQSKWEAYLGSIFGIGANRNGDIPVFGQLAQPSMEPHRAWIQTLASKFAGEAGIPVTALGIIHDNPSSAEAMHAADNGLVQAAQELNETNGDALVELAKMAVAISLNEPLEAVEDTLPAITARFRNPDRPSISTATDAAIKIASVKPEFAETPEFFMMAGFSREESENLVSLMKEQASSNALRAIIGFADGQE